MGWDKEKPIADTNITNLASNLHKTHILVLLLPAIRVYLLSSCPVFSFFFFCKFFLHIFYRRPGRQKENLTICMQNAMATKMYAKIR